LDGKTYTLSVDANDFPLAGWTVAGGA